MHVSYLWAWDGKGKKTHSTVCTCDWLIYKLIVYLDITVNLTLSPMYTRIAAVCTGNNWQVKLTKTQADISQRGHSGMKQGVDMTTMIAFNVEIHCYISQICKLHR